MKKWIAGISAAVLAFTGVASAVPGAVVTAADSNSKYNYGEALQKSMFFYEVQQSGVKPDWNEVSWRSDCMTNDYVPGGWFDAGDHLKFTLTNAYSAALLGWGLLNYGDGVDKAGQRTMYENNLQFALDYLVGCDQGDNIVYMIGEGSFDHVWWGSAEVYMDKEKRFIITESGRYIWNPEISVTTDVWEFEQEARLADQPGTPAEERIPHARRALT